MRSTIRLLFLEDDVEFAALLQDLLSTQPEDVWQVVHALSWAEAHRRIQQDRFDVVLSDLYVPDSQGLETVQRWRQVAPQVPVVVMTGMNGPDLGLASLRQGAQDYIDKGEVTGSLLVRSLRYAIERAKNQAFRQADEQRLRQLVADRTAQLENQLAQRQALFEALPDAVMVVDADGQVVEANDRLAQLLGCTREALRGSHISHWDVDWSAQAMAQAAATEQGQWSFETQHRRPDGTDYAVEVWASRFWWQAQPYYLCLCRDISDRKRVETALAQSEATNRAIISALPDLLIQMDLDGNYLQMLAGGQVRVKVADPSLQDKTVHHILPDDIAEQRLYHAHQAVVTGNVQIYDQVLEVDGDLRDEEVRIVPLNDNEVLVIIRDIGDRKTMERELFQLNQELEDRIDQRTAALRASESRFRGVFDQSPVGIAITDLKGHILRANTSLRQMLGYSREGILQQTIQGVLAMVTPEEGHVFDPLLDRTLPMVTFEKQCWPQTASGATPLWVKVTGAGLLDGFGRPAGFLYLVDDITVEKTTQAALLKVSSLQRGILDSTDYAIISTDPNGVIQTFNAGAERMLGSPAASVVGQLTPMAFHDPEEVAAHSVALSQELGRTLEPSFEVFTVKALMGDLTEQAWTYCTRHGDRVPVSLTISPLWSPDRQVTGYVGIAKDITQQRQAEATAHAFRQRLEFVLSSSLAVTYSCPAAAPYVCTFVSANVPDLLGHPPEVLLENSQFWPDHLHPDDRDRVLAAIPQLFENNRASHEYRFRHRDGHYCWLRDELRLVRNEAGEALEIVGYLADVSDRKAAEQALQDTNARLTLANADLHRATRLKDEFLANMSHELRTPLNAILGMTEALSEGIFGSITDRQANSLQTIDHSGRHLLSLINDILDLSKVEAGKLELQKSRVSVSLLCKNSLAFVRQQAYKKAIRLQIEVADPLPDIEADEKRLRQILINLLSNAVKFTPEGGQVQIVAQAQRSPAHGTLMLQVIDTGIGIAPADQDKLFKPFMQVDSRLNRRHEGTGLGLALVRRLVDLHGGTVQVGSEPGVGSCFTVTLPYQPHAWILPPLQPLPGSADTPQQEHPARPSQATASLARALVLLAEDNDANAASMMDYLSSRGYRVTRALDGQQAIDLALLEPPAIILMDIQMPHVDGLEAIRQIRSHDRLSATPILALTALAKPQDEAACHAAGANDYLTKPVRLRTLLDRIQGMLAATVSEPSVP
ncbi:MAG: PAS domain S-box protein [Leptolyngbya sp.]|nr:PAS domain S-box protein [Leptolyngbya sp.]